MSRTTWIISVMGALLLPALSVSAQQTVNPHGDLKLPCATCHAADSWKPARITEAFKHAPKTFPLEGAHARTSCTGCHKQLDFKGVRTTCASCHEDVHKSELGLDCARCHSSRSFAEEPAMKQVHEQTRFPLRGGHATVACASCHTRSSGARMQFVGTTTSCSACHAGDAKAALPSHQGPAFNQECTSCHTINSWANARFDHAQTAFPLIGAHQAATCQGCHADKVYKGKSTECVGCHRADYDAAKTPSHAEGFPTTCADCHGNTTWKGARFDHSVTRFALTGAHNAVPCASCHVGGVYRGTTTECASCHQANFKATTNPPHGSALFSAPCSSCHTTNAWGGAAFNHDATRFALTGSHRATTCASCHADRVFAGKATDCFSCHVAKYNATTAPAHASAGYPTTCATCHSTADWKGAFNHATTRFPLTGAHGAVVCSACHADGVYRGKSMECASCHQTDFQRTTNPPHGSALFTAPCSSCHSTNAWGGAAFDHSLTQFPLTGSHVATTCASCHADKVFAGKPSACASCHQADYAAAKTPPHAGFPTTCQTCHTTGTWTGATFNHDQTDFPLTGSHRAASCVGCHADGVYNGKPGDCVSCHRAMYDATTRPAHAAAGYSTTCQTCHSTTQWLGATFNHSTTAFPLTGAHIAAPCASCHFDNVYKGKSTDCYSCHRSDYTSTTRPPHGASAIGTACTSCHTTTAWAGGTYDHSVTSFPLTGAHRAVTCNTCHFDGVYNGKPTACLSCHQADYSATKQPPHAANGIGTACQSCHSTTAWTGATFNHSATAFPLTGAHTATPCLSCHGNGVYRGTSTACVSCHQTDYNQTTNPNHTTAGFPTTCASCHTTTTWTGATFNHDGLYFPIYSGAHRGKWGSCATCHTSPTDYKVFTCLSCHEHSQALMDPKHQGRTGYRYDSQACYACHPRGTH